MEMYLSAVSLKISYLYIKTTSSLPVKTCLSDTCRPCLIRPKPDLDFKIRILKPWGCKQTECWIRIRFLENKCKIWIYFLFRRRYLSILSIRIWSKCHCVVSFTFYFEIVDCELLKQIVWSFHWDLPVAIRHLESNESGSGAGFMVSRIRIRFQKIWPKQTQRILKPVSVLV